MIHKKIFSSYIYSNGQYINYLQFVVLSYLFVCDFFVDFFLGIFWMLLYGVTASVIFLVLSILEKSSPFLFPISGSVVVVKFFLERLLDLFEVGGGLNILLFLCLDNSFSSILTVVFSIDSSLLKGMYRDGGLGAKMSVKNLGVMLLTKGRTVVLVNLSACSNILPILCGITCTVFIIASKGSFDLLFRCTWNDSMLLDLQKEFLHHAIY